MKRFPVAEIFGPTVQGEGIDQGLPTYFVRFGGCDYACDWCDTPHAVVAEEVRRLERLSAETIVSRLDELEPGPRWVVLSGGNPVLHDLAELVAALHAADLRVAVETQGSRWRDWVAGCDRVCLSPKPPSSGMHCDLEFLDGVVARLPPDRAFIKAVVFDDADLDFARGLHARYPALAFFASAGNDAGRTVGNPDRVDARDPHAVRLDLLASSRWLTEKIVKDASLAEVRVQSQYHVLLWGNALGV